MAERGLVKKVPCRTDRRGAFVAATARGRRHLETAAPGHVAAVRALLVDRLSPAQPDAIAQAVQDVLTPLAGRMQAAPPLARPACAPGAQVILPA